MSPQLRVTSCDRLALTLFTTPVVYLCLDKLSIAISGWGRSGETEAERAEQDASLKHELTNRT
jgi:hypothetical protein